MIITRTPLRVTLGGGGTDLPSYYESFGGFVVSAAIQRYIYIAVNRTFTDEYVIRYSESERVVSPKEVRHPIVREALRVRPVEPVEIVSLADIPAGTGLGSSGSFTVGILRALAAYQREHVTASALAEEACAIEIDRLAQPVGKQDQYAAAFGGINCFDFAPDGRVTVTPLRISNATLHDLEEHLLMFFTGYSRDSASVLLDQKDRSNANDPEMLDNLHRVKRSGQETREMLEDGDCEGFARLMHDHWTRKRVRSKGMSNPDIDRWYETGRSAGAIGGKLIGAGGGGFLLLYTRETARLREVMAHEGLFEVRFAFDHDGATVLSRG